MSATYNQQIRINKTEMLAKILEFFKSRYMLLNDNDIIKMVMSKAYSDALKKRDLDYSDTSGEELLMQASRVFGVNSQDNEPDNFAKSKK